MSIMYKNVVFLSFFKLKHNRLIEILKNERHYENKKYSRNHTKCSFHVIINLLMVNKTIWIFFGLDSYVLSLMVALIQECRCTTQNPICCYRFIDNYTSIGKIEK